MLQLLLDKCYHVAELLLQPHLREQTKVLLALEA
jgi:hypothetical protein